MMLEQGVRLSGRYRIESVLGQGGMAAVYLARVEALGDKPVAVKEMSVHLTDPRARQAAVDQFRQEARFLANLEHPNLVGVTDFFEEQGRHYLVMAYIKGKTMADLLAERERPFPVEQVLDWGLDLCSVLDYLHTQDPPILFRDLKPSNIMVDETGRVRLIDFGIARVFQPEGVTATFLQGVGSAGYSPLEQYQGAGSTDPRSDIYSLGATLFQLLTARVPPSPIEIVSEGKRMQAPRELNPAIPPSLDQIVHRMTALRKEDRFASVKATAAALRRVQENLHQQAHATDFLGQPAAMSIPGGVPGAAATGSYDTTPMPTRRSAGGGWLLWLTAVVLLGVTALGLRELMVTPTSEAAARPTAAPTASIVRVSRDVTRSHGAQPRGRSRHRRIERARTPVPDPTAHSVEYARPSSQPGSPQFSLPQASYPKAHSQPSLPRPSYPTANPVAPQPQSSQPSASRPATTTATVARPATVQTSAPQRVPERQQFYRRRYLPPPRGGPPPPGGPPPRGGAGPPGTQSTGHNEFDQSPIGY